jgi:hypothetical protein
VALDDLDGVASSSQANATTENGLNIHRTTGQRADPSLNDPQTQRKGSKKWDKYHSPDNTYDDFDDERMAIIHPGDAFKDPA